MRLWDGQQQIMIEQSTAVSRAELRTHFCQIGRMAVASPCSAEAVSRSSNASAIIVHTRLFQLPCHASRPPTAYSYVPRTDSVR